MRRLTVILLLVFILTWISAVKTQAESTENSLESRVEKLYLNYRELDHIYKELHNEAVSQISGPDIQLSYIQKSYLFINEANLVCFYQWRLLSITPYIKNERKSDFFTLRVKGLDKAIFESRDRINSLKLYYSFIDSQSVQKLIDSAKDKEKEDPDKAIALYQKAIDEITAMDATGPAAIALRGARYPINRLSLVMERQKRYQDAMDAIDEYERYNDRVGLVASDDEAVAKRKIRLQSKLK